MQQHFPWHLGCDRADCGGASDAAARIDQKGDAKESEQEESPPQSQRELRVQGTKIWPED